MFGTGGGGTVRIFNKFSAPLREIFSFALKIDHSSAEVLNDFLVDFNLLRGVMLKGFF